ncbi:hypothetical protein REC12_26435 [Desulfosporosinus sp. PR]|uniref:hypothetical protein n=1 Tax=Candidatus Desulfosporosinus nitrosoreducens TaxID=3401928 RepID=UPI0027FFEB6E|nr:hypothetical protein [Desulfosporosinus sp. PR]MDQ7097140.1 hypothetical protein [Desulfosporosinus sp. PR]
MNITNSYSVLLNPYNQNVGQALSTQVLATSNTTPSAPSAATAAQATDSVSISRQAQEAYQALQESMVNSLSPDDSNNDDALESILAGSMQVSTQPFLQIIADKANSAMTGSVAGVSGAASPTGALSTDWGSALDSLVSSGAITQGQETSIETALNEEAQAKIKAESPTSPPTASSNYINSLLV